MDKPFIKKILAVVLGLSVMIMVYETVSLIFGACLFDDLELLQSSQLNDLLAFMKWSAVGLACMLIPTLTCYVMTFLTKGKLFTLISAILSFGITACCIAFLCVSHSYALQGFNTSNFTSATGYFSDLLQIAVAAVLIGVYFLIVTFIPVKVKNIAQSEVNENEEA